ncbi:hypothetical protein EV175_000060 [Coemansia sp. RSA 1933]|nr:hypothetical protein EV175_000060 [Coemansia sp. RSA 1933]
MQKSEKNAAATEKPAKAEGAKKLHTIQQQKERPPSQPKQTKQVTEDGLKSATKKQGRQAKTSDASAASSGNKQSRRSRDRQKRKGGEKQAPAMMVVPRILMRPERAAALADESAKASTPAEQRPTQTTNTVSTEQTIGRAVTSAQTATVATKAPLQRSATAESRLRDSTGYKRGTQHVRDNRLALISPTGKLLDGGARKTLSHLRSRKCIGVLGRTGIGKSLVLSQLARPLSTDVSVFPLSDTSESGGTVGVDLWVTPSRTVLLDTPPVLDLHSSDAWPRTRGVGSATSSRLAIAKTHDLQMASLVLQTCDTLVVVVGERRRRGKGAAQSLYDLYMDRGLARLLATAVTLSQTILGLSRPAEPQGLERETDGVVEDRRCKLHIVINQGPASLGCHHLDLDLEAMREIAAAYEDETGIAVSGVSFLPTREQPCKAQDMRFADIAASWGAQSSSDSPVLPLYTPTDRHRNKSAASLVAAPWEKQQPYLSPCSLFDAAIDELRSVLLGAQSIDERRSDPEGAWLTGCLRAWDSIRRSDALHSAAAMRDDDAVDIAGAVSTVTVVSASRR